MTRSSFASWLASRLGKRITSAGGLGGQCVDLANDYLATVHGHAPIFRNAVDWARPAVLSPPWTFIRNTPTDFPPQGGIVVWGPASAVGIGQYGHIAVALVADADVLVSVDQNWDDEQIARVIVHHDYAGVLGWWRL